MFGYLILKVYFLMEIENIKQTIMNSCFIKNSTLSSMFLLKIIDIFNERNESISTITLAMVEEWQLKGEKSAKYTEFLRDLAIAFESFDKSVSLKLMTYAYQLRPSGPVICQKLVSYNDDVGDGTSVINKRMSLFEKCNSSQRKVLSSIIAKRNSELDCQVEKYSELQSGIITLISCVAENPYNSHGKITSHFQCLMGYAVSAGISNKIHSVRILFTREWSCSPLQSIPKVEASCSRAMCELNIPKKIKDKISFKILENIEHLPSLVSGIVIKLKSVAEHHGSYVYEKKLYENFPSLTGAFNGDFLVSENNDYLLVRDKNKTDESRVLYTQPSFDVIKPEPVSLSKNILTVYAGLRIQILLNQLDLDFWNQMIRLFKLGYKWCLCGYSGADDLYSLIPNFVLADHYDSIKFYKYLDLDIFLVDTYAILFSPISNGGGGTAKLASSYHVPILSEKNKSTDVSLFLPEETLFESFSDQVEALVKWDSAPELRIDFIKKQVSFIKNKTNLTKHDSNLPAAIELAKINYSKRIHDKSILG